MKRSQIARKTPLTARKPMQKRRRKQSSAQKESRFRSPAYLAFVRSLPCCACGVSPCDPHHVIGLHWGLSGAGMTAPDNYAMPLCRACHGEMHREPGWLQHQPRWLVDTINRGLDEFTDEPIVGALCEALEFIAEREAE
ncbi:DUF968 domain-containing protein [Modicisalibacter coralii]|uniref:DUF968 domain-containing protein n=1 Tax=Modicisalibacter coralii TaxID=2304602 RepID=UPI00100A61DD|nr:DUF968 domain-containing protein [Halomonas coralii]